MSRDQEQNVHLITHQDQLYDFFLSGAKSLEDRKVGTEHEKFVFRKDRVGHPLMQFKDPRGIEDLLGKLSSRFGWDPIFDDQHLLTLVRGGSAISLEPAGQLELSGKPLRTIHETKDELDEHLREIATVAGDYAAICSWGVNPFAIGGELPWMPRNRYRIMRNYMANQGPLGHWMMQTTCTIQANFDYTDEADAADIIHTAILISPIVNSIFSNSSLVAHQKSEFQSFRAKIWTQTDNDRCGVPHFMYDNSFSFRDYIEWTLDIPVYFIRRNNQYISGSGFTFRDFLENGWNHHQATLGDYELHLSTLFPEVRLKRYIEVRCCDGGPSEHITALPALWKGILYDPTARLQAKSLLLSRHDEHRKLFETAALHGIHAEHVEGKSMLQLAQELIQISKSGLDRISQQELIPSESIFLDPIETRLLSQHPSLADSMSQRFLDPNFTRKSFIESYNLLTPYLS